MSIYDIHVLHDVQCFKRHKLVRSFGALLDQSHGENKVLFEDKSHMPEITRLPKVLSVIRKIAEIIGILLE